MQLEEENNSSLKCECAISEETEFISSTPHNFAAFDQSDSEISTPATLSEKEYDYEKETAKSKRRGWKQYLGISLSLISSALSALGALIVKLLIHYHPHNIYFWRFQGTLLPTIPVALYFIFIKKHNVFRHLFPANKPGNAKNLLLLFLRCVAASVTITFMVYSIQYISVADCSVIAFSTPVFVSLTSHIFLGEKLRVVPVICGIITMLGVIVITRPPILTGEDDFDTDTLIGSGLAFGCMIGAVVTFLVLRSLRKVHFTVTMLAVGLWGSIQTLGLAVIVSEFELPVGWYDWFLAISLGLATFLAQIFITAGLKFEEAGIIALTRTFDIVFAFIWQYMLLGDSPHLFSLLGGFIVIFGVAIAAFRKFVSDLPANDKIRQYCRFILW